MLLTVHTTGGWRFFSDFWLAILAVIAIVFASMECFAQESSMTPEQERLLSNSFGSGNQHRSPRQVAGSPQDVPSAQNSQQYPMSESRWPAGNIRQSGGLSEGQSGGQNVYYGNDAAPNNSVVLVSGTREASDFPVASAEYQELQPSVPLEPSESVKNSKADQILQKELKGNTQGSPSEKEETSAISDKFGFLGMKNGSISPIVSIAGSLAVVLSVFFILAWLMKRATPVGGGLLPKEVFEKLGSVPFTSKMQLHLFRLGGKLILASVTPDGMEAVAEITNPDEVIHLVGLCKQNDPNSSSAMFRQVLKQYTGEQGPATFYQNAPIQQHVPQPMQPVTSMMKQRPVGMVSPAKAYQR